MSCLSHFVVNQRLTCQEMTCGYRIWSENPQTRIWFIDGIKSHKVNHRSILKEKQMGKGRLQNSTPG